LRIDLVVGTSVVIGMVLTGVACTLEGNLVVGPVRLTERIGKATFFQSLFLPKTEAKGFATITHQQNFCNMPSEDEFAAAVLEVGEFDFTRFFRLHELDVVEFLIKAKEGDFDFLTEMTIRYIPKPGAGDPVEFGTASDPDGLGREIVLVPPEGVDFLELIRANDASDSEECPKLEFELTYSAPPLQDVEYRFDVTVDAFVEVGNV
jgi:hypothetical protein